MKPKLVIFDLDGTLTESKQPLSGETASLLSMLLLQARVAIISGGMLSQLLKQVIARLPGDANLSNLYLLPTSGAALYEFHNDEWKKVYEERLTESQAQSIDTAMRAVARETGIVDFSKPAWGERIEYRGTQVTLSALGQEAPISEKKAWDPGHIKRRALQEALAERLPEYSVKVGGSTSIDVTQQGIDKAYGLRKLCERLGMAESDAIYVGDELSPGGNDEAVFKTDVKTKSVDSPADTARIIESLLF